MRVLGIDPGTLVGYGIVDETEEGMILVDGGVFTFPAQVPIEKRLHSLYEHLNQIIDLYQPDEVAVEEPFLAQNARTALALGRVQAVVMLAAATHSLPVYRYSPTQVKEQITNYGSSSKEQVKAMVKIQLGLGEFPYPDDVADALAIAICHLRKSRINQLLTQKK